MHKQVSGCTVNFGPNFPESPFLESQTRKPPPSENFRFGMTKVYSGIPPLLENFRFGMTKVFSRIPPPFRKTSDLGWPKFTPEYPPPISENFRFGMTKVYSGIPPPISENFQIWDDQSLLWNTPPFRKTSDLGWPKFTPEYPPPHFGKLQIWDDQSLLRNTPPISENFRFGMTKVYWFPQCSFNLHFCNGKQDHLANCSTHGPSVTFRWFFLLWFTPGDQVAD